MPLHKHLKANLKVVLDTVRPRDLNSETYYRSHDSDGLFVKKYQSYIKQHIITQFILIQIHFCQNPLYFYTITRLTDLKKEEVLNLVIYLSKIKI